MAIFLHVTLGGEQQLVGNANLISKVYFPRLIIPAGAVITSLVDFFISFILLAVLMAWYGFMPDWRILALTVFTIIAFLAALGPRSLRHRVEEREVPGRPSGRIN